MHEHSRSEFDKIVRRAAKVAEFWTHVEETSGLLQRSSSQTCLHISRSRHPSQNSRRWRPRWQSQGPVSQRRVTQLHGCGRGGRVGHEVDDVRVPVCGCFRWRRRTRLDNEGCVDDPVMVSRAMPQKVCGALPRREKTILLRARGGGRCAGNLSVASFASPRFMWRRTWTTCATIWRCDTSTTPRGCASSASAIALHCLGATSVHPRSDAIIPWSHW